LIDGLRGGLKSTQVGVCTLLDIQEAVAALLVRHLERTLPPNLPVLQVTPKIVVLPVMEKNNTLLGKLGRKGRAATTIGLPKAISNVHGWIEHVVTSFKATCM
jgi:hypothetical protein